MEQSDPFIATSIAAHYPILELIVLIAPFFASEGRGQETVMTLFLRSSDGRELYNVSGFPSQRTSDRLFEYRASQPDCSWHSDRRSSFPGLRYRYQC